jgi:hypothetical protein
MCKMGGLQSRLARAKNKTLNSKKVTTARKKKMQGREKGTVGVTQAVECLSSKHKAMSSDALHHKKESLNELLFNISLSLCVCACVSVSLCVCLCLLASKIEEMF